MNDANAELTQELIAIVRAATCGPLRVKDAVLLCYGLGLDSNTVLPRPAPRGQINPQFDKEWIGTTGLASHLKQSNSN